MEYISYSDYTGDQPTVVEGIEQLAVAAVEALDGGCEFHWMRAATDQGERPLTRGEQVVVLVEMERLVRRRGRGE